MPLALVCRTRSTASAMPHHHAALAHPVPYCLPHCAPRRACMAGGRGLTLPSARPSRRRAGSTLMPSSLPRGGTYVPPCWIVPWRQLMPPAIANAFRKIFCESDTIGTSSCR
ncbi:unnamed protein product [Closterium sp. NIES-54]